jgi:para-aminobenzoate synthetase component I
LKKHIYLIEKVPFYSKETLILEYFTKLLNSAILDSSLKSDSLGRYTIIGYDPFLVFEAKGENSFLSSKAGVKTQHGNPIELLRELLLKYKTNWNNSELPFLSGCIGYFSYDLVNLIEEIPIANPDDIALNDIVLGFYNKVILFDHIKKELFCIGTSINTDVDEDYYNAAAGNVAQLKEILEEIVNSIPKNDTRFEIKLPADKVKIASNFEKEDYLKIVRAAREYIRNGDIFQVNLSQRFETFIESASYDLYMRLRTISKAPFSAFLNFGQTAIISSSPERFLKITGNLIESRPIKGTRPRGKDKDEDAAFRDELLRSEKDKAELTMIVDLVRNDLGRVCRFGSVYVKTHGEIEAYANVFHTVSTVIGELKEEKSIIDCLYAAFPGGSITGAPKIRAMEIIEELEPCKRNIYTGSIGYIDFNGNTDLNIAIRTIVLKNKKAYYNVGGGIVWDSEPEAEYEETMHKGRMMMKVLEEGRYRNE